MLATDRLLLQATDRQYLITTDDEDDLHKINSKGYKIQELIFNFPYDSLFEDRTRNVSWPISENVTFLSENLETNCRRNILAQDNNNLHHSDVRDFLSKTTQTFFGGRENVMNTSSILVSISTQTPNKNHSSLSETNTSSDEDEINFHSLSSNMPIAYPKLIGFSNQKSKVSKIKSGTLSPSIDNDLSDRQSAILTYSLDKCRDSKSYYIECIKSRCSSSSYDELQSHSDIDRIYKSSAAVKTDLSTENELLLFLNPSCTRFCYLPIEVSNQGSLELSWEFFKTYELKKFDEVVKSHLNRSDRRLKAISNRMGCKFEIFGPYYSCSSQIMARNSTELYKLEIYANTSVRLEKSINCIQLSFPNSCFNEKIFKTKPNLN